MNDPIKEGTLRALEEAKKTLVQRGEQYDTFPVDDYMLKLPQAPPMVGYMQMLHLKTLRAISCTLAGEHEGALDSLKDLINYSGFMYAKVELSSRPVDPTPFSGMKKEPY